LLPGEAKKQLAGYRSVRGLHSLNAVLANRAHMSSVWSRTDVLNGL